MRAIGRLGLCVVTLVLALHGTGEPNGLVEVMLLPK